MKHAAIIPVLFSSQFNSWYNFFKIIKVLLNVTKCFMNIFLKRKARTLLLFILICKKYVTVSLNLDLSLKKSLINNKKVLTS